VLIYALAIVVGVALRARFPDDSQGHANPVYGTYKDMMPFLIAIPAAWLGYCFQRRGSYLAALRSLWDDLIPAVRKAIQYTYLNKPDELQYLATIKDLDVAIDSLRGVFRNIPGSNPSSNPMGLYPYENLKDIQEVIRWLCYATNWSDHSRYWARRSIRLLWASTHQALLQEFDREVPTYHVGKSVEGRKSVADILRSKEFLTRTLTDKQLDEVFKAEEELQLKRTIQWKRGYVLWRDDAQPSSRMALRKFWINNAQRAKQYFGDRARFGVAKRANKAIKKPRATGEGDRRD
jgi:hypothetical protein